jgi:penicillin-binding protein 1C
MVSKEYAALKLLKIISLNRRVTIASMIVTSAVLLWYVFCLPSKLFDVSYSTVLYSRNGELLNASIASDGQWRFPASSAVPHKFKEAITQFEDKRFFQHPGVDPFAIFRALRQNIKAGKVVSGGSTLTMQVMRLARGKSDRGVLNKVRETILATRLELSYSKDEIMALYSAHAPFGGNVVGLEAACWRYLGRQPDELSWGEAALLAVLPNNPSLIHLSRNRKALHDKRDRLLTALLRNGKMDSLAYELALAEELPAEPLTLPRFAPHLMARAVKRGMSSKRIMTTIDADLQSRVASIARDHHRRLSGNHISNVAALVLDVETGNVLAYLGNVEAGKEFHEDVDVISSPRSTGSILKPFLYAALLDEGSMLQQTLVPDIPTVISGFAPRNFSREYDGAVPADKALIRSLNVPAVIELKKYRYEKFYDLLQRVGISTLSRPADYYGLAMILGGAEGTLWDITGSYASMSRTLNRYFELPGKSGYRVGTFHSASFLREPADIKKNDSPFSAASIYLTFEALKDLYRPGEETGWRNFYSSKKVAWKTGTSFGFRDGWAVGVNPKYAVGVWVGNADGEGRPGLTGTETAAPIMFDIFSALPGKEWFDSPLAEMTEIEVCSESGQRVSSLCPNPKKLWVAEAGLRSDACAYHKTVHLTANKKFRVHGSCEQIGNLVTESWFVLPPAQEYYFRTVNISHHTLPPFRPGCSDPSDVMAMDIVYPREQSRIFIPRELDGTLGSAVFQAVHRNPGAVVYWHLDGEYLGSTTRTHRLPLAPAEGTHELTLVDEQGEIIERTFQIVAR